MAEIAVYDRMLTSAEVQQHASLERVLNFCWCGGSLADVEPQRISD
jgi:hypothetical protein